MMKKVADVMPLTSAFHCQLRFGGSVAEGPCSPVLLFICSQILSCSGLQGCHQKMKNAENYFASIKNRINLFLSNF